MYALGMFDPEYSAEKDDSLIVCPGSNFIGPIPPLPAGIDVTLAALEALVFPPPVSVWQDLADYRRMCEVDHEEDGQARWTPVRRRPILKPLAACAVAWAIGVALVFHLPDWWMLVGYPIQWGAVWKACNVMWRRRPARRELCDDDAAWPIHYRGTGFGFSSAQSTLSVRAVPAEWRSDDGS